jgi:hypothetical protein
VFGRRTHIDLMWSGVELHIINIEIINKSNNRWLRYKRDEEQMGGYDSTRERGPRGNYSWVLIQPTFLKLLSLCITFYLLIECMRSQSFKLM